MGLDHLARHRRHRRRGHRGQELAVGKVEAEPDRVAVDGLQPLDLRVEIEPAARADFDGRRHAERIEEVETARIDDLALQRVRLLKIDAEGMEHKVLAGASNTLRRCRPVVFVEYEKTDFDALKALLRTAGYRAFYAQRPNILCLPAEFDHIRIEGAKAVAL